MMNRLLPIAVGMLLLLSGSNNAFADHPHGEVATADITNGKSLYNTTCVACHGANGKGPIPGVPDLRGDDSRLIHKDLNTLLHNVEQGFQSPGSMMAMPPRGGNPGLSEQDLVDILGYMRKEFAGADQG